jgi:hypothetical protein
VKTISAPALILLEGSGRWASSLRRHGLVERLPLVEARSLLELEELICPQALVGLEITSATAERVAAWLVRRAAHLDVKVIIFSDRRLRRYELLCREAGAVHFVAAELELFGLAAVIDRYLSQAVFAKLDQAEQPLAEQIMARVPW